jgi:hypothetical protein
MSYSSKTNYIDLLNASERYGFDAWASANKVSLDKMPSVDANAQRNRKAYEIAKQRIDPDPEPSQSKQTANQTASTAKGSAKKDDVQATAAGTSKANATTQSAKAKSSPTTTGSSSNTGKSSSNAKTRTSQSSNPSKDGRELSVDSKEAVEQLVADHDETLAGSSAKENGETGSPNLASSSSSKTVSSGFNATALVVILAIIIVMRTENPISNFIERTAIKKAYLKSRQGSGLGTAMYKFLRLLIPAKRFRIGFKASKPRRVAPTMLQEAW